MKILIIGGGVSGLSAGIYLLLAGHEVTVAEQHSAAGGNLTGWRRAGCTVDNCIHWLCGTDPRSKNHAMWETLGVLGGVPVYYGESLYTVDLGGRSLSLYSDTERTERELLAVSPEDGPEIRRLMRAVRTVQAFGGTGTENGLTSAEKAAGAASLVRHYRMTTGELAARFRSPLIRKFISSFLTERFGAIGLIFVFADFCAKNAGIPAGGSIAAAGRMAERFTGLGGSLLLNKKVIGTHRKGRRLTAVSFEDGSTHRADAFVFAQDPASVFGSILDIPMPKKLAALYKNSRLIRFSSLHCAFLAEVEKLPFTGDLITDLPAGAAQRLGSKHLALREYSYLENSAPKGQSLLCGMAFCDERTALRFIELRGDKAAYEAEKLALAAAMAEAAERELPELSGKLHCIDVWTPATYRRFTGSRIGSYMSFAFSSRVIPRGVSCKTGLGNAVLATQWLRPPGGLPIAAGEGKRTAEVLIKMSAGLERTERNAAGRMLRIRLPLMRKRRRDPGTAV
ncbi:MAG: NAD(P)/FAD-dependent oxidoreductase [Clostridia bacterium]|nr:NAD(P)/FAD-dependent oxidoreductase [Clostridia bacterium]